MNEANGEANRSVVQMRIDKAMTDWQEGRKDEAFEGVLKTLALLSTALSFHSRTYIEISNAVDKLKEANAGPQ